jgi:hypothetical protein
MPDLSNLADQLCSGLRRQESDFGWDLIIGHVKAFRDEKGNSYICTPEEFAILLFVVQAPRRALPRIIHRRS